MFDDSFTQLEHGKSAEILDLLNPQLDGSAFDPSIVRVLSHDLPFYEGHTLVEVSDYDVNPPRRVSFIMKEGDQNIIILNGTNEPIYKLNKELPITLDDKLVFLYVRFFFHYVRGRFGRFLIVENVDEVDWKEEPAPAGKRALGKMINPISLHPHTDGADYNLTASIIFKDSLFQSDITVKPDGEVSLSNQELLVEDIPVLDDTFGQ